MRAVRIHGPEDIRVDSIPIPVAGPGEVLIKVTVAGVCGTDAAFYRRGPSALTGAAGSTGPRILGHEFAGRVVGVGAGVGGLEVDDLLACGAGISCGACARCIEGRPNLCEHYQTVGIDTDGGLAEYCSVPTSICEPVTGHGVRGDAIALAQPMAIAIHSIDRGGLRPGQRALILGAGGVGALAVWVASRLGAEVTACARDAGRLAVAASLGARFVVEVPDGGVLESLAGDRGWDVVYEMTGAAEPFAAAQALVRPGGRVVVAGVQAARRPVDAVGVLRGEIEIIGTAAHVCPTDLPRALDLIAERDDGCADIAPRVYSLELVAEELPALAAGRAGQTKLLVDPSAAETRSFAVDLAPSLH